MEVHHEVDSTYRSTPQVRDGTFYIAEGVSYRGAGDKIESLSGVYGTNPHPADRQEHLFLQQGGKSDEWTPHDAAKISAHLRFQTRACEIPR